LKITDILKSPPDEFRPYPFWFWNGELSKEEITWQMEECRRQKIYAVMIHPRHGLVTPYLGDEYMAMIVHTVKEAERLGMKVWLYDEYNWPSGTVAGRLLRDYPQYRMKYLHHEYRELNGGDVVPPIVDKGELMCIQGTNLDSGEVREFSPNEKVPPGRWGIAQFQFNYSPLALDCVRGHSHTAPESGYLDVMNPDAVAKFIELTHEVYYRHLKDYFGTTVIGIFTDEVGVIYDFDFGYDFGRSMTTNLPWTPALEQEFRKAKGYSLREKLIHLIADVPGAETTRRDYWDVVIDLYTASYHQQVARWCDDHRIAYTGHNVCEEMSLHYQGDLYRSLKEFHVPGLDWTSKDSTLDTAFVYQVAKTVSSTIHLHKRQFAVCETFGASGWGLTLNDMKHVTDYLYALGINLMCLHGFFYSLRGARVHECSPSEFFQSPWWKYMATYSDYTARLGALLSQGKYLCSLGVFVPTRSYLGRNNRTIFDAKPTFHADAINRLCRVLLENGADFELVFDSALNASMITPQGIQWGDEQIDTLIIPPCDPLDPGLEDLLAQFQRKGGKVIRMTEAPDAVKKDLLRQIADNRVALFDDTQESEGVLIYRRVLPDNCVLCFACNASTVEHPSAVLAFPENAHVEEIDLEDCSQHSAEFSNRNGRTLVSTSFRPHQSRLFLLTPTTNVQHAIQRDTPRRLNTITLGPEWTIVPEKENILKIENMLVFPYPTGDGFEVHFRLYLDSAFDRIQLLIEGDRYRRVAVNAVDVTSRRQPCRYFDGEQLLFDITDQLRPGENRVCLDYHPLPEDVLISPLMTVGGIRTVLPHVFVLGNFRVAPGHHLDKPVTTLTTGPWQQQGFPYYAGTIAYKTNFRLTDADLGASAILTVDVANDCVEVLVNGTPCGTRIWQPYTVDITRALKSGDNTLELRVTNTAMSLQQPLPDEINCTNPLAWLAVRNRGDSPSGLLDAKIEIQNRGLVTADQPTCRRNQPDRR